MLDQISDWLDAVATMLDAATGTPWLWLAVFGLSALDALLPFMPSESSVVAVAVLLGDDLPALATLAAVAAAGALAGDTPGRAPEDYLRKPDQFGAVPPGASRRVDTPPVTDRGAAPVEDTDPLVVPSRLSSSSEGFVPGSGTASGPMPGSSAQQVPQPRRVEHEMVAGKPVFVLYRPSRGLEVRDQARDTDSVVR
nr:hypothetical protein [Saccharomonospora saliphila]